MYPGHNVHTVSADDTIERAEVPMKRLYTTGIESYSTTPEKKRERMLRNGRTALFYLFNKRFFLMIVAGFEVSASSSFSGSLSGRKKCRFL